MKEFEFSEEQRHTIKRETCGKNIIWLRHFKTMCFIYIDNMIQTHVVYNISSTWKKRFFVELFSVLPIAKTEKQ